MSANTTTTNSNTTTLLAARNQRRRLSVELSSTINRLPQDESKSWSDQLYRQLADDPSLMSRMVQTYIQHSENSDDLDSMLTLTKTLPSMQDRIRQHVDVQNRYPNWMLSLVLTFLDAVDNISGAYLCCRHWQRVVGLPESWETFQYALRQHKPPKRIFPDIVALLPKVTPRLRRITIDMLVGSKQAVTAETARNVSHLIESAIPSLRELEVYCDFHVFTTTSIQTLALSTVMTSLTIQNVHVSKLTHLNLPTSLSSLSIYYMRLMQPLILGSELEELFIDSVRFNSPLDLHPCENTLKNLQLSRNRYGNGTYTMPEKMTKMHTLIVQGENIVPGVLSLLIACSSSPTLHTIDLRVPGLLDPNMKLSSITVLPSLQDLTVLGAWEDGLSTFLHGHHADIIGRQPCMAFCDHMITLSRTTLQNIRLTVYSYERFDHLLTIFTETCPNLQHISFDVRAINPTQHDFVPENDIIDAASSKAAGDHRHDETAVATNIKDNNAISVTEISSVITDADGRRRQAVLLLAPAQDASHWHLRYDTALHHTEQYQTNTVCRLSMHSLLMKKGVTLQLWIRDFDEITDVMAAVRSPVCKAAYNTSLSKFQCLCKHTTIAITTTCAPIETTTTVAANGED